jgi:hypothetical protein
VRYDDLLADWRSAMAQAAEDSGTALDLGPTEGNPVDDFIDPTLSRHRITWDEVDVPESLTGVAEEVWQACDRLTESGGRSHEAQAAMDVAREHYERLYRDAQNLTRDATSAAVAKARREGERTGANRAMPQQPEQLAVRALRRGRAVARRLSGRLSRR